MSDEPGPPTPELPDDLQPAPPSAGISADGRARLWRATLLWIWIVLFALALLDGWVSILSDSLADRVPAFLELEEWWRRRVPAMPVLTHFVAPITAEFLHRLGGTSLAPHAIEQVLLGTLRRGLLMYPLYALVAAVIRVLT